MDQRYVECRSAATKEMIVAFPELKRVPGFVYAMGLEREHFWCETSDGEIVDPTAAQFRGVTAYIRFEPGDTVRVGTCMNCGDGIYEQVEDLNGTRKSICSETCYGEMRASLDL